MDACNTSPCSFLGQAWYWNVLIPDLYLLAYFCEQYHLLVTDGQIDLDSDYRLAWVVQFLKFAEVRAALFRSFKVSSTL